MILYTLQYGRLAQLVEHSLDVRRVSGSSPLTSTSLIGLNTATIQKYIREQEKEEQIMDKLKTKEYIDPFKGSN